MSERRGEPQQASPVAALRDRFGSKLLGCAPMGCLGTLLMMGMCIGPVIGAAMLGWLDFLK